MPANFAPIQAFTAAAHKWINAISGAGVATATQPAAADLSDTVAPTSWTPAISFGGAFVGVTYGTQVGTYYKIGKLVIAQAYVVLTSKGSSTGAAMIGGLPVASNSTSNAFQAITFGYFANMGASVTTMFGRLAVGSTSITPARGSTSNVADLADTDFTFSLSYTG